MRQAGLLVGLRLLTIGSRFALTIAVTLLLGVPAMGVLTLAIGAAGLLPSIVGGGLNYFLSREAVGQNPADYAPVIRDRLHATLAALSVAIALGLAVYGWAVGPLTRVLYLIALLAAFETVALEQYLVLLGLRKATLANILVFLRSAAWVAPAILLIWAVPALRSIDTVLVAWLLGHVAAIAILVGCAVRWRMNEPWRRTPPTGWVRRTLPRSWFIYLSDLGLAGMSFSDRFVISALLGIGASGVFGFYWSYANALQTLVLTAFVQPRLPDLLEEHRRDPVAWRRDVLRQWRRLAAWCLAGAGALAVLITGAVSLAPAGRFPSAPLFATILFLAVGTRTAAEFLSTALSGAGANKRYAIGNIVGVTLTLATVAPLSVIAGLPGAAAGLLITAAAITALRLRFVSQG